MRTRGAVARWAAVADAALEESVVVCADCGGALSVDVPGGAAARLGDLAYGLGREMGTSTRWLAGARGDPRRATAADVALSRKVSCMRGS